MKSITQSAPNSIEVAITVPSLWKNTITLTRRLFGGKRVEMEETGAKLVFIITVIFPNGKVSTVKQSLRGKSGTPYTLNFSVE